MEGSLSLDVQIDRIKSLLSRGESVKMKNKEQFRITLVETQNIIAENKVFLQNFQNQHDANFLKILSELDQTIRDVELKLNKLAIISFCRDRAEKYLERVTEKLKQINMVLLSFLAGVKTNVSTPNTDQDALMNQIKVLNGKILEMEESLNRKAVPVKIAEPKLKSYEVRCLDGIRNYLGLNSRVNFKVACEKLLEASSMGSSDAKIQLAKMHEKGEYVIKSYGKAFEYYRQASEQGNSYGSFMIGHYAENHLYDDVGEYGQYSDVAMEFYEKSAQQGNSDALTKLGMIYENGLLGQLIDDAKAIELYKQAIDLDENPEALNCLGSIYYKGIKIKQNYMLAVEYFLQAARLGNVDAMNNLGLCYEYGKGTERNVEKAMEMYKQASEKLHPIGLTNQAILLIKMNAAVKDKANYQESFKLLQLAIHLEENNKDGFYYLGYLYEIGANVIACDSSKSSNISNPYLAYLHYKKAADLGHVKAKTKVAIVMYNGLDDLVKRNEEGAVLLLQEAAVDGEPEAMNYLGLIYEKGTRIVEKSMVKCVDYLSSAVKLGHENASINLQLINNQKKQEGNVAASFKESQMLNEKK